MRYLIVDYLLIFSIEIRTLACPAQSSTPPIARRHDAARRKGGSAYALGIVAARGEAISIISGGFEFPPPPPEASGLLKIKKKLRKKFDKIRQEILSPNGFLIINLVLLRSFRNFTNTSKK